MDVLETLEEKAFWGHEFLTWLWFRIEESDGDIEAPGIGPVSLWIADRIVLGSLDTESKENILKDGQVSHSGEAATALKIGKKLQEARFGLLREDREWSFLIKGDTFDLQTVNIPRVETEKDDDWQATVVIRIGYVQECIDILDALFAEFCRLRVSAAWTSEMLPAVTEWIRKKEGG
jgi:hypothetical protein